jgi:hypothetical protein
MQTAETICRMTIRTKLSVRTAGIPVTGRIMDTAIKTGNNTEIPIF